MTLSDRQLEQLLHMAREADDAAAAWDGRAVQSARGDAPVVMFWKRVRVFAAAASIALFAGVAWWSLSSPVGLTPKGTGSNGPDGPIAITDPANVPSPLDHPLDPAHPEHDPLDHGIAFDDPESTTPANAVVLAIVPDDAGELRCVRWLRGPLAGASGLGLAGVHADELRAMGLGMLCEETAPRILVVGLEGPAGSLPASDSHAADLARCILKSPGGKLPGTSEVCTPGTCMPNTVRMRMEAVTVR